MQYAARSELEDTIHDEDFLVGNTVKILEDYEDEVPSAILTGLVVERIEGYLNHKYTMWCVANEEELADEFSQEISDIVMEIHGAIESTIEELQSQMNEADKEPNGRNTEVFDT